MVLVLVAVHIQFAFILVSNKQSLIFNQPRAFFSFMLHFSVFLLDQVGILQHDQKISSKFKR